jgi:hypothetical protein
MTDWALIERHLDDHSVNHACAFCGERILAGDTKRWSLAVRRDDLQMSVLWIHPQCFVAHLHPLVRGPYSTKAE